MSAIYSQVGRHVRSQRLRQNLTLEDLSELSGLHASFIGQIERGAKKSSLRTISRLADSLGIHVGKLFGAAGGLNQTRLSEELHGTMRGCRAPERRIMIDVLKNLARGFRELRA